MLPRVYDLAGIGIGPFNLGLAALAHDIPELDCLFLDHKKHFDWHPGMMLDTARMQVPFYADLVTLADPTSPFTYLNFLKHSQRLLRFGTLDNLFPTRTEYNQYAQWVATKLPSLQFGQHVSHITFDERHNVFEITHADVYTKLEKKVWTKNIVVGVGTPRFLPGCARHIDHPLLLHSDDYLFRKEEILLEKRITIIGAGQSAAEIFDDLLQHTTTLDRLEMVFHVAEIAEHVGGNLSHLRADVVFNLKINVVVRNVFAE